MSRCCDKCGQPLPAEVRRDPPLPPLDHPAVLTIHDHPAVLTIHDLPADERARARVEVIGDGKKVVRCRKFVLALEAVDAREGRG